MLAMTLHNIPEGLAVGVLFGAAIQSVDLGMSAALAPAIALAIGIGIQNFPEGVAVSLPLRRDGMNRGKSFWYGQLSGIVEPVSAVVGAAAVILVQPVLPLRISFCCWSDDLCCGRGTYPGKSNARKYRYSDPWYYDWL